MEIKKKMRYCGIIRDPQIPHFSLFGLAPITSYLLPCAALPQTFTYYLERHSLAPAPLTFYLLLCPAPLASRTLHLVTWLHFVKNRSSMKRGRRWPLLLLTCYLLLRAALPCASTSYLLLITLSGTPFNKSLHQLIPFSLVNTCGFGKSLVVFRAWV